MNIFFFISLCYYSIVFVFNVVIFIFGLFGTWVTASNRNAGRAGAPLACGSYIDE